MIRVGPLASAARISARLVMDFDPGTVTCARTGPLAAGVAHGSCCCSPPMGMSVLAGKRPGCQGLAASDPGYERANLSYPPAARPLCRGAIADRTRATR